jgi:hypothetical protein
VTTTYRLLRFRCPACRQRLAVEAGQARRGEVVVCQDCNTEIRLQHGRASPTRDAGDARVDAAIDVALPG